MASDGVGDFLVEIRHDPIQHLGQIKQHVLAFVGKRQALSWMILGLPAGGELGADATDRSLLLGGRKCRVKSIVEQLRQSQLLAKDGASRRLRRVRHEHRRDVQGADQLEQLLEREASGLQLRNGIAHAPGLWTLGIVLKIRATSAYAVHLLGQIDRLEPHGKGALEIARLMRFAPADVLF